VDSAINPGGLVYSFGLMLAVVISGSVIFNRVEATCMDKV